MLLLSCSHDIHMTIECMNLHMIFNVDMDMHMIERSVKLRMNMNVDMSIHMIIEWNFAHSFPPMHNGQLHVNPIALSFLIEHASHATLSWLA